MSNKFLPTKQYGENKIPLVQERNPNDPTQFPFRISRVVLAVRICCWLVSMFYMVFWSQNSHRTERAQIDVFSRLIFCSLLCVILSDITISIFWKQAENGKRAIDQFNKIVFLSVFSILIRPILIIAMFTIGVIWGNLLIVYTASAVTSLVIDTVTFKMYFNHYRMLFDKQLQKTRNELKEFLRGSDQVEELAKKAQMGYFIELEVPRSQIKDGSDGDVSGSVKGGLVLSEGECVFYCVSRVYTNGAKKMTALQAREIALRTEQMVLKGEDVEEEDLIIPSKKISHECKISIKGIEEVDQSCTGLGELEPPKGSFSCIREENTFVLLEDCRSLDREIVDMEKRLNVLRTDNRVLRDAIKHRMKRGQSVDEAKEENIIDDVD